MSEIDLTSDVFTIGAAFRGISYFGKPGVAKEMYLNIPMFNDTIPSGALTYGLHQEGFAFLFKMASEDGSLDGHGPAGTTTTLRPEHRAGGGGRKPRLPSPPGLVLSALYKAGGPGGCTNPVCRNVHPDLGGPGKAVSKADVKEPLYCLTWTIPGGDGDITDPLYIRVEVDSKITAESDCQRWRWIPRETTTEIDPLTQSRELGGRNIWQLEAVLPRAMRDRMDGGKYCLRTTLFDNSARGLALSRCDQDPPHQGFLGVLKRLGSPRDPHRGGSGMTAGVESAEVEPSRPVRPEVPSRVESSATTTEEATTSAATTETPTTTMTTTTEESESATSSRYPLRGGSGTTSVVAVAENVPSDPVRPEVFSPPSRADDERMNDHEPVRHHDPADGDERTVDLKKDVFSFGRRPYGNKSRLGRFCVKAWPGRPDDGPAEDFGVGSCGAVDAAFAFKRVVVEGVDDPVEALGNTTTTVPHLVGGNHDHEDRLPSPPGILVPATDYYADEHHVHMDVERGTILPAPTSEAHARAERPIWCLTFTKEETLGRLFYESNREKGDKKRVRTPRKVPLSAENYRLLLDDMEASGRTLVAVVRRPTADGCARWRWFPLKRRPRHDRKQGNMWALRLYLPAKVEERVGPLCLETATERVWKPLVVRHCGSVGGDSGGQRWVLRRLEVRHKLSVFWLKLRRLGKAREKSRYVGARVGRNPRQAERHREEEDRDEETSSAASTDEEEDRTKEAPGQGMGGGKTWDSGMSPGLLLIVMVAASVVIGLLVGLPVAYCLGCAICFSAGAPESEEGSVSSMSDTGDGSTGGRKKKKRAARS
eukprot:g11168.t1